MDRTALIFAPLLFALHSIAAADHLSVPARIEQALHGEHRSAGNQARNRYRHPVGTLDFFELKDGETVMEIWPGGGWYTEILAPLMRDHGQYIAAVWDDTVEGQPGYRYRLNQSLREKLAANTGLYDQAKQQPFSPPQSASLGAADSIDLIVTFRNAHGWIQEGLGAAMFTEFARVLKAGGRVGVVQHRAAADADPTESAKLGYVPETTVIELAEAAGLRLKARSEINANPKDSKDYADGVWTLPPRLLREDKNREKYLAIGESDRMTLLFEKPAQ